MIRLKKSHKAQISYIQKCFTAINPKTPAPTKTEKLETVQKGSVYSPRKDIDAVMSGKIVDMYD
jgi:hypothetical protein